MESAESKAFKAIDMDEIMIGVAFANLLHKLGLRNVYNFKVDTGSYHD